MNWIDKLLNIVDTILEAGQGLIPGDAYLLMVEKLIQKGVAAYESQSGKPIDVSLLHKIDPIP